MLSRLPYAPSRSLPLLLSGYLVGMHQINLRRVACSAAAFLASAFLFHTHSAAQQPDANVTVAGAVNQLQPGEFIWAPQVAPEGPMMMVVSLQRQKAYVYRNGVIIGVSTVSTGTKNRETPTGVFTILQKHIDHKSNLYSNAPMPFMQRLTWGGIALHAGKLPGYPASHGCIRLPTEFAKLLYGVTARGMTVVITGDAPVPRVAPSPDLLTDNAAQIKSGQQAEWRPNYASVGPISIIISTADRRLVVLRNGKQIGSAPITLNHTVVKPTAYVLRAIDDKGLQWLSVSLPWDEPATATIASLTPDKSITIDEDFRAKLVKLLLPGATVVITADTLRAGSTGEPIMILSDDEQE